MTTLENGAHTAAMDHDPALRPHGDAAERAGLLQRWLGYQRDYPVARANALPYGLAAYGFTKDLGQAHRLAQELQAGMVGINHFGVSQPETPFGGIKDSGYGHESGLEGLLGCTEVKLVSVALS